MILYKKAQYGFGVKTQPGNLNTLMGNDSLSTASGRETHAARGYGQTSKGYSVAGDQMVDGKRQLTMKWNGGSRAGANQRQLMQDARSSYLGANPNSTNTAAPDLHAEYIANNTKAPLPAPAPKKPLMAQSAWQESRDKARRNTTIAPVQSQSAGISGTSAAQSTPLGLDGQPTKRKYLGSFSF